MIDSIMNLPDANGEQHNPLKHSMDIEHDVRYNIALGQISQLISDMSLSYLDFCNIVIKLNEYYESWAKVLGESLKDEEFTSDVILPSILEPWIINDDEFYDDED
jgi:hypothetical protein